MYPDIDTWEAESVAKELGEDKVDAIQAAMLCEMCMAPWEDMTVFSKVALTLNDRLIYGDAQQDLDIKEIAYAVDIMKAEYPDNLFNDEVAKYIACEAIDEGFVVLPVSLAFAQHLIPNVFINPEQEQVQILCLNEVNAYKALLDGSDS